MIILSSLHLFSVDNDANYMVLFWSLRASYVVYSFLFILLFTVKLNWTEKNFINLLILTFAVHSVLAWLGFFFPSFHRFYFDIQHLSPIAQNVVSTFNFNERLPVFGMVFFGSGVLYAICQILVAYKISLSPKSLGLGLLLFYLAFTGVSIARVAIIGFPFVILVLALQSERLKAMRTTFFGLIAFSALAVPLSRTPHLEPLTHFLLEPIRNIQRSGKFTTRSIEEAVASAERTVDSMQQGHVQRNTEKTHLETASPENPLWFGSGRLFAIDRLLYYQATDVGFIRLLLFGGVVYTLLFFLPTAVILLLTARQNGMTRPFFILLSVFAVQLISNLKGVMELTSVMIFLFLVFLAQQQRLLEK